MRAVGVDPAAGAVGIRIAGGGLERHGGIALGHERIDAGAHHRDEAQIGILRLQIADGLGDVTLAVDLEGLRERDARLPRERAGGRLHLQNERVALRGGHLLGGGGERLRRDRIRREIFAAQRLEILPRRGDHGGIVWLVIDELRRIDRGRRAGGVLGRDALAEHREEHVHAFLVVDDVFVEGVNEQQREEQQNADHREHRAPDPSPAAPPGTVNIGMVRCHK